jgi:hypothetical protein
MTVNKGVIKPILVGLVEQRALIDTARVDFFLPQPQIAKAKASTPIKAIEVVQLCRDGMKARLILIKSECCRRIHQHCPPDSRLACWPTCIFAPDLLPWPAPAAIWPMMAMTASGSISVNAL